MITLEADGRMLFRVYLPHAQRVELTGEFNKWVAGVDTMREDPSMNEPGWWIARIKLEPGEYRFAYLVNSSFWMPDYAASGVERNQHGHFVSVLKVATRAPVAESTAGRDAGLLTEEVVAVAACTAEAVLPGDRLRTFREAIQSRRSPARTTPGRWTDEDAQANTQDRRERMGLSGCCHPHAG